MLKTEIAEVLNRPGKMYEIAERVNYKRELVGEDKEIYDVADAWVREIGEKGHDPEHEIASFIKKTVTEEVYNAPDELLDSLFERGSVGEFDDSYAVVTPKNTLIAYDAAKGGNVDRSFIDWTWLQPTWKNKQVETDLSYVDMRRGGFKSVATLTTYATEALQNQMFYDMFSVVDAAITGGEQLISVASSKPTLEAMDQLALYLNDREANASTIVTLTKYAQAITRMEGYAQYMSDAMRDEFNRYGLCRTYDGLGIATISGAHKTSWGQMLLPDKRIYGIAGKIGTLDMKGDIHVYEDEDNQNELIKIKVADFTFGYAITDIDKVAKIVLV
jgi:hypothetical protein